MNAFMPVDKGPLSELEWKIVESAREDGALSLNPDGALARLARFVGIRVPNGLANDELEALRRFSVRAWHWDLIRSSDLRAFLDSGHSRTDVLEILSRIGMARGFVPTIEDQTDRGRPRNRAARRNCG